MNEHVALFTSTLDSEVHLKCNCEFMFFEFACLLADLQPHDIETYWDLICFPVNLHLTVN